MRTDRTMKAMKRRREMMLEVPSTVAYTKSAEGEASSDTARVFQFGDFFLWGWIVNLGLDMDSGEIEGRFRLWVVREEWKDLNFEMGRREDRGNVAMAMAY